MNKLIFCALFLCAAFAFGDSNIYGQENYKTAATEKRVKFGRGKTSIVLTDKIKYSNDGIIYLVDVGGNQKLSVRVISASGDFELYIVTPDNQDVPILTKQEKSWSGTIVKMGDVEITMGGKRDNFSYKIQISVVNGNDSARAATKKFASTKR